MHPLSASKTGIIEPGSGGVHVVRLGVTRIDDDRRRSDSKIPAIANRHANFIDDFSAVENRRRHRKFYDTWGHVIGEYDVATTTDYRTTSGYPEAKQTGTLAIRPPQINVDTGYPIINMRVPVYRNGAFIGSAGASITLGVLSRFLAAHRASPHSTTIIADATDGEIIGASEQQKVVRTSHDHLEVTRMGNVNDEDMREAQRLREQTKKDEFLFRSPQDGQELSVSFAAFPESFRLPWEAVILTPTDDFIGQLKATNRQIVIIIAGLSLLELLLIYVLSRRLSRAIEGLSRDLKSVETLSFDQPPSRPSGVREIAQLQAAASLFAIRSNHSARSPQSMWYAASSNREFRSLSVWKREP